MASSKEEALKVAEYLGCSDVHKDSDGNWMPCDSHETLQRISNEAETTNPKREYKTTDDIPDQVYRKTKRKKRGSNWENLSERGPVGIDTLSGGGLVSAEVSGKALPRLRNLNQRFDPNAIDGDDDGFVQDGTSWQRPDKPRISKRPSSNRRFVGAMEKINDEDESALKAYRKILAKLSADDFDVVPDYVEAILSGENRESLADYYPDLASLPDSQHADLVRGYILDRNLLPDDSFGTDELDDFDQPFRLIDAFSTDDLIDFEDYVSDRFDPSISEDELNRMYPHFSGLSIEELKELQDEYDALEETALDESFIDSLGSADAPNSRPLKPVQMTLDFGAQGPSSPAKRKKTGSNWLSKFKAKKKKKRYWNDAPYAGDKSVAEDQKAQVAKFKEYASNSNWKKFHSEHYDWWTFPIDRGSIAYGERYNLAKTNIKKLRKNKEFTDSVAEAARLYTSALAWDLYKEEWIDNPDFANGQSPSSVYGTRIWKMARSLQVLGLCKEFNSVRFMIESYRAHTKHYVGHLDYWDNPGPCPDDRKMPLQKKSLTDRFDQDAEDGDGDGLVQDSTAFERPIAVTASMSAFSRLNDEQKDAFEKAFPVFEKPEQRISEVELAEGPSGSVIMTLPEIPGLADKFGEDREKIKTNVFQPDDDEVIAIAEAISDQVSKDLDLGEFWVSERSADGKKLMARTRDGQDVYTINNAPQSNRLGMGLTFLTKYLTPLSPIYDKQQHEQHVAKNPTHDTTPRGLVRNLDIEFADTEAGRFAKEQVDSIVTYSDKLDEIAQHYNPIIKAIRERLGLPETSDRFGISNNGTYLDIALDWMRDPEFKLLSSGGAAPFEHIHDLNHFVFGLGFDRDGEWRNGAAAAQLLGFEAARQQINFIYSAQSGTNGLKDASLSLFFDREEILQYIRTTPEMFRWYK
jgi:hypothetical protein